MSSTPLAVVSSTKADSSSPSVEPLVVVDSLAKLYFQNTINYSSNSMIPSGPRALGGYSLSLLSNSNCAAQAGELFSQPGALSGNKRPRAYSFPLSIPKRQKPSLLPIAPHHLTLLVSSSTPIVPTSRRCSPPSSAPNSSSDSLASEVLGALVHPILSLTSSSPPPVTAPLADLIVASACYDGGPSTTMMPFRVSSLVDSAAPSSVSPHLSSLPFAPQIPFHYSPGASMGPLTWHPADYKKSSNAGLCHAGTGGPSPTSKSLLVDPRRRFRGRPLLLLSPHPCAGPAQGGGGPPPPPPSLPRFLPGEEEASVGISSCNESVVASI